MKKSIIVLTAGLIALALPGVASAKPGNGIGHAFGLTKHHDSRGRGAPGPEAGIGLAMLLGGVAYAMRRRARRQSK